MSQDAVVRALLDPAFYPHRPAAIEHVQTHISHVFLAGPFVYKLKKAVRFPFLDFSTPERRHHFCLEEVRLNRRLCPSVYLDVLPIAAGTDGMLRLGGGGPALEHVVWMRRLPADRLLATLLSAERVEPVMMEALAGLLAEFHADAPTGPAVAAHADPEALRRRWAAEMHDTASFVGRLLPPEDHEVLGDFGPTFIHHHETLLRARQQAGHIREGHGDLHAEHVCFLDAPLRGDGDHEPLAPGIYVFDCIEFSHAFRCNDVASEVAFLAMDLESRGEAALARRFVAAYAHAAADAMIPVLLPFYASYRAIVRGKVEGLASESAEVNDQERQAAARRAREHFTLAIRHAWEAGGPAVVACAGLAGSGKTTLAAEIAAVTGFMTIGSDVIRSRVAGEPAPASAPYGAERYSAAARAAVYEALVAEADAALARGVGVVADATFIRRADRQRLAAVARRHGRPCIFVECRASETVVRARLAARTGSLSDARWDTYLAQRAEQEPFTADEPRIVVDASGSRAEMRGAALRALWQWRQARPIVLPD